MSVCSALIWLSVMYSDLYPGQQTMVTAAFYCETDQSIPASLALPISGIALAGPNVQIAEVPGGKGATLNWRITAESDAPRMKLLPIYLVIDGQRIASTAVRVLCNGPNDLLCKHVVYVPYVATRSAL